MAAPFNLPLGSPPQAPPGVQPRVHDIDEYPGREYVAEDGSMYYWPGQRVLDPTEEHIGLRVNAETFAEMSREPKIHKSKRILIAGALTDDLQFAPGVTEEEALNDSEFQVFAQVQHFSERMILGLEEPVWRIYEQMMDLGIEQGHAIAETNWEERVDEPIRATDPNARRSRTAKRKAAKQAALPKESGAKGRGFMARLFGFGAASTPDDSPKPPGPKRRTKILDRPKVRLMPKNIKPKPHGAALFVVDRYMNTLGLVPAWLWGRTTWNVLDVISRDKFLVFTVNPRNGDPRGTSAYWPIMDWYALKRAVPLNYRKYLSQEALPIPILKLPPNAQGWFFAKDPATGEAIMENGKPKFIEAVEAGRITVENMYSGKGVVVPDGVEIKPYEGSASKANVFPQALDAIDGQMEEGLLMQQLAQSQGKGGTQKGAMIHEARLNDQFFWYKRILAVMTVYDFLAVGVRINLGQWALAYLPLVSLGDSEKRDWANDLKTVAQAYFWGFIDDSMRAQLCAWLGLPKPGPSRFETNPAGVAVPDANGNPVVPNPNRPDKQPGQTDRNKGNSTPKDTGPNKSQDVEYQAWLDSVWPDGTPRTFKSATEAQAFIAGLREDVKSTTTRFSTLGHNSGGRRSFVGYLPGRAARKNARA